MSDSHVLVRLPYPDTIPPPASYHSLRTGTLLQRANDDVQCRGHIARMCRFPSMSSLRLRSGALIWSDRDGDTSVSTYVNEPSYWATAIDLQTLLRRPLAPYTSMRLRP